MLTGCGADSEANIANDVEAQQFNTIRQIPEPPSNHSQNRERMVQSEQQEIYASEAGHYLSETATLLENVNDIFEQNQVTSTEINEALSILERIRNESETFVELSRPGVFDGFHHVHLSTLVEIDALRRILEDMKEPVHHLQLTNARVYYENAVMSHKLMEREYLSVTEDLGIY